MRTSAGILYNFFLHIWSKLVYKCVEFARLRHKPECTVYTRQAYTQPVHVIVYTVYSVQRAVFVILPPTTRRWSPLVNFVRKWRMENGKWELNMKWNIFLRPQSLVIWKRNCSTCAVEPATVVPVSLLSAHTATLVLSFCSSGSSVLSVPYLFLFLFLFPELEELSVRQ